jgi:hypothetical protein
MPTATKLDLKRELKELYTAPTHPVLVQVPSLQYLMIEGAVTEGMAEPGDDPEFGMAIQALYAMSYTLKFDGKARGQDHVVMPLEGLFWTEGTEGTEGLRLDEVTSMKWTLMIVQPAWVTQEDVDVAARRVVEKGKAPGSLAVRLETLREDRAAQVLHMGPYAEEPPTIEKLHAFIDEMELVMAGKHHEIYLSDPNRTAPERLKTIIRQPARARPTK